MKTVVIDKKDVSIKIESNALKVEGQSVPFRLVDLLILNHRVTLHTSDILKLTTANISVLIISHANDNFSLIQSANVKNAEIKFAQYAACENHLPIAKMLIAKKIEAHAQQLLKNGIELNITEELSKVASALNVQEIMGVEGSFAVKYFKEFFTLLPTSLHKAKRSKQPPLDPVNTLMSYWYTLYYYIITVQLFSYGFEPSIGYLHTRLFSTYDG